MNAKVRIVSQLKIGNMTKQQERTGSLTRPWLSRETGPISSGVPRNSGPLHTIHYPSRSLPPRQTVPGPLPCSNPSFPLLFFATFSLAPFSPLQPSPSPLTQQIVWPTLQHLTWRPTWTADQPAHLASARQPAKQTQILCHTLRSWRGEYVSVLYRWLL